MTLSEYLRARRETREQFGRRIGVHAVTVSKWCSGAMRPSWPKMERIADATEQAVTAADFMRVAAHAPEHAEAARDAQMAAALRRRLDDLDAHREGRRVDVARSQDVSR